MFGEVWAAPKRHLGIRHSPFFKADSIDLKLPLSSTCYSNPTDKDKENITFQKDKENQNNTNDFG